MHCCAVCVACIWWTKIRRLATFSFVERRPTWRTATRLISEHFDRHCIKRRAIVEFHCRAVFRLSTSICSTWLKALSTKAKPFPSGRTSMTILKMDNLFSGKHSALSPMPPIPLFLPRCASTFQALSPRGPTTISTRVSMHSRRCSIDRHRSHSSSTFTAMKDAIALAKRRARTACAFMDSRGAQSISSIRKSVVVHRCAHGT